MPKLGYSFEISDWNPCSVTCGGGSQDRTVSGPTSLKEKKPSDSEDGDFARCTNDWRRV